MKSTRRWQQLLLNSLAIILGNALYSLAVALFPGSSRAVPPASRWPSGG